MIMASEKPRKNSFRTPFSRVTLFKMVERKNSTRARLLRAKQKPTSLLGIRSEPLTSRKIIKRKLTTAEAFRVMGSWIFTYVLEVVKQRNNDAFYMEKPVLSIQKKARPSSCRGAPLGSLPWSGAKALEPVFEEVSDVEDPPADHPDEEDEPPKGLNSWGDADAYV